MSGLYFICRSLAEEVFKVQLAKGAVCVFMHIYRFKIPLPYVGTIPLHVAGNSYKVDSLIGNLALEFGVPGFKVDVALVAVGMLV